MNVVVIMGRLVADPIVRTANGDLKVANLRIAVDRPVKKGAEKQADFFDVVAWRHTAEFVEKYFVKGKPILIQGRLQSRNWTDKNEQKRVSIEIVADNVEFCGGDKVEKKPAEIPNMMPGEFAELPNVGDDLPWKDDGFEDIAGLPV